MQHERAPLASVEQVREELRRLGYLDVGLDRFVLAGAVGASPLEASLRAALRIGFAAAHPTRQVPRYGERRRSRSEPSAFDADVLEELPSLGYIR